MTEKRASIAFHFWRFEFEAGWLWVEDPALCQVTILQYCPDIRFLTIASIKVSKFLIGLYFT